MSPFTVPLRMTFGTATEPSTTPVSLTLSDAPDSAGASTLPLMWPSMWKPPLNCTSPMMRVAAPISVSMRCGLDLFLNMGLYASALCLDLPGIRFSHRREFGRTHFERDRARLEAGRHG